MRHQYRQNQAEPASRDVLLVILIDRTDKAKLEQELSNRANMDQLTEVYSRAYFLELLEKERQRAKRYAHPLSVIYLDVDYFKSINDRFGHYIGDLVLRGIGSACKQQLRTMDICGRLGGEEFALALPETPLEDAKRVAERIRGAIAALRVPATDRDSDSIAISASLGVAADHSEGENLSELLNRADAALYRAKAKGRNRVEVNEE